jgi:hypothetical protein
MGELNRLPGAEEIILFAVDFFQPLYLVVVVNLPCRRMRRVVKKLIGHPDDL